MKPTEHLKCFKGRAKIAHSFLKLEKLIQMKHILIFFFLAALTASCATPAPATEINSDTAKAKDVLIQFFALLNAGDYAEAETHFGGSYEQLQGYNPDIDPSDHVTLWRHGCELNGLVCLSVHNATIEEQQGEAFIFQVEFNNPDGSLFVRGPCCGADETDMPPVSQFEYRVMKTSEGNFLVMDMPPYVP